MNNKEVKIAIIGAFAGIVFTALYDLFKSKPILSTLWNWLRWIWNNIFEFELTFWQIILGIVVLIIISNFLKNRKSLSQEFQMYWGSYCKDKIHDMNWSWYWEKDPLSGKWSINDLRPVCDSCETKMHLNDNNSWDKKFADCPRCGQVYNERKDLRKVEAVIIDNLERGIFPKGTDISIPKNQIPRK